MANKRDTKRDPVLPDFKQLPQPIDLTAVVETHDVDPAVHKPDSKFATPEIEELTRTGAIGVGF
jgi:hypothetical protein